MTRAIHDESLLDRARDHALRYVRALDRRHVGAQATRDELLGELAVPLSHAGEDPAAVIDALAAQAERAAVASAGPRYFGYVIGGSLPVGLAADWLTSAWDQNAGTFSTSPLAATVEEVARAWLLEVLDLPRDAGVGFVTGCQMANFTCLAAARHGVLGRAGWNVEEDGLPGAPRVNLVVSAEAHVTIHVAMRHLGFGTRALHHVTTDGEGRMQAGALREILRHLTGPTIVCAQAGNVNTGAFDPLPDIASIAREREAWLHVDGAFGLWARASRRAAPLAAGVELADSWATDAHKWLNVPYDCGIAIVRDAVTHRASMTSSAAYLVQTQGVERDPIDWVPEFSRRARGIAVYAALRTLGRIGLEALIDRGCARARQMADVLGRHPRIEILNHVVLNQVLVRCGGSDELTRAVIARVQQEGTCWLGGTTWHGRTAMRVSVAHWATDEDDVERSAAAILSALDGVSAGT